MIPVIQHDGAQRSDPRLAEEFFPAHRQTPTRQSERVGHFRYVFLCGVRRGNMFGCGLGDPVANRFTHQVDPPCSELQSFLEAGFSPVLAHS